MFPNLVMLTSSQRGAISGKLINGNLRGINRVNGDRNERIPFVFTCEPEEEIH